MRKLLPVISLLLFCACESISTSPDPHKSNRSFSNIDKVTYVRSKRKSTDLSDLRVTQHGDLKKYDIDNLYSASKNNSDDELYEEAKGYDAVLNDDGHYQGIFKVGNPYEVEGVSYFPQNYEEYEETGTASWYGPDFHGKPTANGEICDSYTMTAAHPTLPLPSMVKVTNLRNGKSVIVRVNDRGPFAKGRVIDVSKKAAEELGFKGQGTTEVHIQLLRNYTDQLLEKLKIKN